MESSAEKNITSTNPAGSEAYVAGELLCLTQTKQQADEIAQLYNITLKSFDNGIAVFTTEEDLQTVIDRGKKNGWVELYKNMVYHALSE
ncbi:hypothetical protein [Acetanaerobacterium elongatum]|nr:hypothetical protein [Acetanaerobacterium elongatum]